MHRHVAHHLFFIFCRLQNSYRIRESFRVMQEELANTLIQAATNPSGDARKSAQSLLCNWETSAPYSFLSALLDIYKSPSIDPNTSYISSSSLNHSIHRLLAIVLVKNTIEKHWRKTLAKNVKDSSYRH